MADAGILSGFSSVGRYFQLVSIVPSSVIVVSTYAVVAAGAPARRPTWESMGAGVGELGLLGATTLGLAVLVVGMIVHPFQYPLTQVLEGYWGPSAVGRLAMSTRARIHADRLHRYLAEREGARDDAEQAELAKEDAAARADADGEWSADMQLLRAALSFSAFEAAALRYPDDVVRVMPTRLGNVLRRSEDNAGGDDDLDALQLVPKLMAVAPRDQVDHVNDARADLDLAVRFVVSWLVVSVVTFVLLLPFGPWLLLPLAAYVLAWISYFGAVHAASEYGSALEVLVELNSGLLDPQTPRLILPTRPRL